MMSASSRLYSADELCTIIANILHVVDNAERRRSEAELTVSLQQPSNVGQLVTILCGSPDGTLPSAASAGVRQLAAVLLRKRIFSLWRALSTEEQAPLQQLLLQQLAREPTRPIRFAIAHVVTRLAKADANHGGGGWTGLQQAIRVAAEDSRVEMRELAMVLLYSCGEVFAEENALSGLAAESVVRGLVDSETVVQMAAAKAAMVLLPALHEHPQVRLAFLTHLVPTCVQVLEAGAAVEAKVPLCVTVLDLVEQLFSDLSVKRCAALVQELVDALQRLLANPRHHPRVRENGGAALGQLTSLKPKFVATAQVLESLVRLCLELMAEDDSIAASHEGPGGAAAEEELDAGDDDEDDCDLLRVTTPCMVGGRLLSALATTVASKTFTAVLLPYISKVTDAPANVGPRTRKAAMLALACLAEGHASYLRRRVGYVLTVTSGFLRDAEPVPREAAAFALSYFCAYLQPEILLHHSELMPMLVPLLQDPNDLVRRRVAKALDNLCENLEDNLDRYVPEVLPAVMAAIPVSSLETQCCLCAVLSSMGASHSTAFANRGPELLEVLRQPFALSTPETMALRAQATETVGVVGSAMGRDAFAAYFPFFMQEIVANLSTEHATVREHSFGFLANMCELFQDAFLPYLNDSVQCALQTIATDKTIYRNKHLLANEGGEAMAAFAAWKDDDGCCGGDDDDDESDGGDGAEEIHMRVRTADVEEKSSAVYCLGVFAEVLMGRFSEQNAAACWEALTGLDSHYYPNIRSNAFISLAKLAKASAGLSAEEMQACSKAAGTPASTGMCNHLSGDGTAGVVASDNNSDNLGHAGQDVLPLLVRDRVDELLHLLLRVMEEETEKEVVGAACEAVTILMNYFGTQCAIDGPDAVLRNAVQLLRGTLPCQRDEDDDDDDDADDDDSDGEGGQISYEQYEQKHGAEGADRMYRLQGKDPLFRVADEAIKRQASALVSLMHQQQQAGMAPAPPSVEELPPWYTTVKPEMVVQGVHLAEDHDEAVVDPASEMLESVAKAYGPALEPYMPFIVPLLTLHADVDTRPSESLVTAIGTLASVLQSYAGVFDDASKYEAAATVPSEQLLAPFTEAAVQLSLSVMSGSEDSTARANSAYLLRVLVEGCPSFFVQHSAVVPQCLQLLWSIVGNDAEEIPEAGDNAVSATCSLLRCLPPSLLPLDQVIPPLMANVPMKMDKAENANAIRTLCYLLNGPLVSVDGGGVEMANWLPSVAGAVARVLAASTVTESEKQQLVNGGAAAFAHAHSQAWQQAVLQGVNNVELQAALHAHQL